MKISLFRPTKGAALPRVRVILAAALAALALSAVMASSASAFGWWIGTQSEPEELKAGEKLLLGTESKVKTPFTLKWLKKDEVSCAGAKYAGLYIEGPIFLGARKISFEECKVKKPKGATVAGGKIETTALVGEIKPAGSKVAFNLKPVAGLFASFTLEQTISPKVKHKHKRKPARFRRCKTEVSVSGQASGDLGDATKISNEKSFEFASKELETSQVRSCKRATSAAALRGSSVRGPSGARPALTEQEEIEEEEARELREEEEEEEALEKEEEEEAEAIELEEKEEEVLAEKRERIVEEAEACKESGGSSSECKTLEKEAKEIEEVEAEHAAEKKKEAEELAEEKAKRAEEETIKPIEGNKGNNSYNGGFGWGV